MNDEQFEFLCSKLMVSFIALAIFIAFCAVTTNLLILWIH